MTRTIRCWNKGYFLEKLKDIHQYYDEFGIFHDNLFIWTRTSMCAFGRYKNKRIRKETRKSIRCANRTKLSHNMYDNLETEDKGEYFD